MMTARPLGAVLAALGLALAPLASDASVLLVPGCGGGSRMLVVPHDPTAPADKDRGCPKACHAVTERRGKVPAGRKSCC